MAKRRATWMRWGGAMAVVAAALVGASERGWGQEEKTDAVTLEEAKGLYAEMVKLHRAGKYDAAILAARRELAIELQVVGLVHPIVVNSLNNLALLYDKTGDYAQAKQLYRWALAMGEKLNGSDDPAVATTLNNLAGLYCEQGDYASAEPLYERALAIRKKVHGPEHPDVAEVLNNLALLYQDKGDYVHAEPLFQHALTMTERALGREHADVANSLSNLAGLYYTKGDYRRAEPLFQRALAMGEKVQGPEHPDVATFLNGLATLYVAKGDYAGAEPLYQRALTIKEKALGPEHPHVATSLNNLALLHHAQHDYGDAEPLLQRALAICENAAGPEHPSVATSLNNLAALYYTIGDYERAEPLYQRALAIKEKALGPDHPDVATLLNNLAELYHVKEDYVRAAPPLERALAIYENALGLEHPSLATSLNNKARLHWVQNDINLALHTWERGISIEDRNAARELAVGNDEKRRAYMQRLGSSTESTISLCNQAAPRLKNAKQLALRAILRRKGVVLDAMANSFGNLRERLGSEDQKKFDSWLVLSAEYSARVQHGPKGQDLDAFRNNLKTLDDRRQKLENELSFASKDLQAQLKPVTVEQVQAAIPEDAVLVELYRYHPFNPKAKGTENPWGTPRFVAYILHPNGYIEFADLGEAKPIEDATEVLRNSLSRDATDPKSATAKRLHQLVWAPIQKLLGNTRHIYLSPDGDLNLVPFEALVDATDHYVVESFAITYLPSGRDLVRRSNSAPCHQPGIVFAGPDYYAVTETSTSPRHAYPPLLHARAEAEAIAKLMLGTAKYEGINATEAAVKAVYAPTFLHISTHGFFAENEQALHASPDKIIPWFENPLSKSGLALAGANRSGLGKEDGLLTALEASQLNLWGTKLVVLSACDTGNGHVENGDSVYGLRRAFGIAGAETIVMSLWQVDGQATTELMTLYYQGLSQERGRAESLRQAQLAMLDNPKRSHPYYWASFIVSGDDRPMDGLPSEPVSCKIHRSGCGGACAIGASEETGAWRWIGMLVAGAWMGMMRRGAKVVRTLGSN